LFGLPGGFAISSENPNVDQAVPVRSSADNARATVGMSAKNVATVDEISCPVNEAHAIHGLVDAPAHFDAIMPSCLMERVRSS